MPSPSFTLPIHTLEQARALAEAIEDMREDPSTAALFAEEES